MFFLIRAVIIKELIEINVCVFFTCDRGNNKKSTDY